MPLLYNFAIFFYYQVIRIASLSNPKAKLWVNGRKDIFKRIKTAVSRKDKIAWFHCASLGEFEQGRPIIELSVNNFPVIKFCLPFSPLPATRSEKTMQEPILSFICP